jgi:hypothetical protein
MKTVFSIVSIIILMNACGSKTATEYKSVVEFGDLKDVREAPNGIFNAAKAVVHVGISGLSGTGSFISQDGILLTNNHVVGLENCSKDGCYIHIKKDFQFGEIVSEENVFAKPLFVSPELDVSILQLHETDKNGSRTEKHLQTPDYLEFDETASDDTRSAEVYMVGHPLGRLKKFSKGKQNNEFGDWFYASTFQLPGNSGSPFLTKEGKIVGILHRGLDGSKYLRRNGMNFYAVGSTSEAILREYDVNSFTLRGEDRTALFFDVKATNNPKDVVKNYEVYLNRHEVFTSKNLLAPSIEFPLVETIEGTDNVAIPELLGQSCDQDMAEAQSMISGNDVRKSYEKCDAAMKWINCNEPKEKSKKDPTDYCPSIGQQEIWNKRFATIAKRIQAYNLGHSYFWEVHAPSRFLQGDKQEVANFVEENLQRYLKIRRPKLDLDIAYQVARFTSLKDYDVAYNGQNLMEYVTQYKRIPAYEHFIDDIAETYTWLTTRSNHVSFFKKLQRDGRISLGDKLYLEELQYEREID